MKIRIIKEVVSGLAVLVLLSGCAVGGVSNLGKVSLSDGSVVEAVSSELKSNGVSPSIARVDVFLCRENCDPLGSEGAAGKGWAGLILEAIAPAAVLGGAAVSSARMLRPAKTVVQTNTDVMSFGGSGGLGGDATRTDAPVNEMNLDFTIKK